MNNNINKKRIVLCQVDCEQSLFFFRFSEGVARERWAAKPREARNEGGNLAPLVKRVSRTFCWTDQEKRETARSLFVRELSTLTTVLLLLSLLFAAFRNQSSLLTVAAIFINLVYTGNSNGLNYFNFFSYRLIFPTQACFSLFSVTLIPKMT